MSRDSVSLLALPLPTQRARTMVADINPHPPRTHLSTTKPKPRDACVFLFKRAV